MTAIAAVCDGDHVWLGGDSVIGLGKQEVHTLAEPKVWIAQHGVGIGFATNDFAEYHALRYHLRVPAPPSRDLDRWAAVDLLAALEAAMRSARCELTEGAFATDLLIAARGRIWHTAACRSVFSTRHGYAAIGSGSAYALGSLASTSGSARSRVGKALRAAERHCPSVRGPFLVIRV